MICPVCRKECIDIKDGMAIHRYMDDMDDWVANMCVVSSRTVKDNKTKEVESAVDVASNESENGE